MIRTTLLCLPVLYILVSIACWTPFWITLDGVFIGVRVVAGITAGVLLLEIVNRS